MRLIYWLGEGLWVCCLCVCWSRGLIWNQYRQWFMVCVHCGAGTVSRKESEIWEYYWTETSLYVFFPLVLFFFFFFFAHHAVFGSQLISSCVALMRQPARGDIYIRRWGWEVEPSGMKSWFSGSSSLQNRRCISTPAFQNLIHALLSHRHTHSFHTHTSACWAARLFCQQSTWAGFDAAKNSLFGLDCFSQIICDLLTRLYSRLLDFNLTFFCQNYTINASYCEFRLQ